MKARKEKRSALHCVILLPLVAALLLTGLGVAIGVVGRDHSLRAWERENTEQLARVRHALESQLNQAANASASLGTMIEANPTISPVILTAVAERLLDRIPVIRSFAIAPDNVIALSVPLTGNEAAIGLDLMQHPVQSSSVKEAIQTRRPVLGGPYHLVQGPFAVIHRVPVFIGTGDQRRYWGLVSTPIEVDQVIQQAGLSRLVEQGRLALRGTDGTGRYGAVFLGPEALFSSTSAMTADVRMLDGDWFIAFEPEPASSLVRNLPLVGLVLGLAVGLGAGVSIRRWQLQQQRLADSERTLREVTTHVRDIVFRTDATGRLVYLSPAYTRLTGLEASDALGGDWREMLDAADRLQIPRLPSDQSQEDAAEHPPRLVRLRSIVGESLPAELRLGSGPEGEGIVGMLVDLSDRQAYARARELASSVFTATSDPMVYTDRNRMVLAVNPAFEQLVGLNAEALVGRRLRQPLPVSAPVRQLREAAHALRHDGSWSGELPFRLPSGERRMLAWTVNAIRDPGGMLSQFVAVIRDTTEQHERLERMRHLAMHDALTGLLNRTGLDERFTQARALTDRHGQGMALAFFDLDGFKPINDQYGHAAGDQVLVEIARRLREWLREADLIARLGGDEFLLVFTDFDDPAKLEGLGRKLLDVIDKPVEIEGRSLQVSASIGFCRYPQDGQDFGILLRTADHAMYQAKLKGRNRYVIHQSQG
ncbi:MAG: diguanylate cyclase domain-containing protein [Halothiobacillaceae bacterium]